MMGAMPCRGGIPGCFLDTGVRRYDEADWIPAFAGMTRVWGDAGIQIGLQKSQMIVSYKSSHSGYNFSFSPQMRKGRKEGIKRASREKPLCLRVAVKKPLRSLRLCGEFNYAKYNPLAVYQAISCLFSAWTGRRKNVTRCRFMG